MNLIKLVRSTKMIHDFLDATQQAIHSLLKRQVTLKVQFNSKFKYCLENNKI